MNNSKQDCTHKHLTRVAKKLEAILLTPNDKCIQSAVGDAKTDLETVIADLEDSLAEETPAFPQP